MPDLPGLGARLQLPDGWELPDVDMTSPLRIDTTTADAPVQDNLGNTYSLSVD